MSSVVYSRVASRRAKNNVDMAGDSEYSDGEEVELEEAVLPGISLKVCTP
jgi:hypothetical protein